MQGPSLPGTMALVMKGSSTRSGPTETAKRPLQGPITCLDLVTALVRARQVSGDPQWEAKAKGSRQTSQRVSKTMWVKQRVKHIINRA